MFDHLGFHVSDFVRSRHFYSRALKPLGVDVLEQGETWAMLGRPGKPQLWIGHSDAVPTGVHLAFAADSREQVREFHAAALAAGGRDNGGPGLRPHYHPNYYGAFVIDPDGHNVEAVYHGAEP